MALCGESLIATGGSDNVVRVWNLQTGVEVDRFVGHTGSVAALAFDPTSGAIISGSFDTTIRVWKVPAADGKPKTAEEAGPEVRVR